MKLFNLTFHLGTLPPVFKRGRLALILVSDDQGQLYLSQKKHYPEGISRLLGGGLEGNEDPHLGAARELNEETGITVNLEKLSPLLEVCSQIFVPHQPTVLFTSYLYHYALGQQHPIASDDVDNIITLSRSEYQELVTRFTQLPSDVLKDSKHSFAWADYGKVFAPIHSLALEEFELL